MIKYLGSKRRLVATIGDLAEAAGARSCLDLFTGTTRVAQELKRRGLQVGANDTASYSAVLAATYIATDALAVDTAVLADLIADLNHTPGVDGYVTDTFCHDSRYFQPANGRKIDAIRQRIETEFRDSGWYPILLTALLEAADRVDSTTGLQMAYLKQWSPRSYRPLELRVPELLPGTGCAHQRDAAQWVTDRSRELCADYDIVYLDPPYNQHRYLGNYHVWETIVRWDAPEHYGVACKRIDLRDPVTKTAFDSKRTMPTTFHDMITSLSETTVIISYNNESWIPIGELTAWCEEAFESCAVMDFPGRRYIGAHIGIHNPGGARVGTVGHTRNVEHLVVAGPQRSVAAMSAQVAP